MSLLSRHRILDELDAIYDAFSRTLGPFACREGCDACCTRNVTVTTLEADRLIDRMDAGERSVLFDRLRQAGQLERFRPSMTTNALAEMAMTGEDVLEEGGDPAWGPCPLLHESRCPVYRSRPFGCRSFSSASDCRLRGIAEVPPLLLSANTIFFQTLEHIDRPGLSGNLTDVLLYLAAGDNHARYRSGSPADAVEGLLPNRPMAALMVPPEHRDALAPLLEAMRSIRMPVR
ncbi:MAG: YkgJ family cysteine cluster protein [Desulfobacterales bacterium]|jgi:Fe-S-cluster containining protein